MAGSLSSDNLLKRVGSKPAKMLSNGLMVVTGVGSFLYTFHVLYLLMCFTSGHNESHKYIVYTNDENSPLTTLWILLVDACLLSAFMLQHSFMARESVKNIWTKLRLTEIERSVYNTASAGALHFLMNNWRPVPWISFWNIDTLDSNKLWIVFVAFHALGWFVVYSGCLMMDISELAGLKQVYYKVTSRPCPLSIKSRELQRYYAHMRHPSFTGFLIVLWIHPFMTIDRVLLSSLLTIYMIMMWSIDQEDYRYHANTVQRKRRHLS